jgi:hypothetical protein
MAMSAEHDAGVETFARSARVMLRTLVKSDRAYYERWQSQGKWRTYDAHWERETSLKKSKIKRRKNHKGIEKMCPHPKRWPLSLPWVTNHWAGLTAIAPGASP